MSYSATKDKKPSCR